jgi:hypothetical protein
MQPAEHEQGNGKSLSAAARKKDAHEAAAEIDTQIGNDQPEQKRALVVAQAQNIS